MTAFVEFAFQNVGHWMFSYEYYNMVRTISYVLDETPPPESIVRSNRIQFWFWLVLNTVVAFLLASANYFLYNFAYVNEDEKNLYVAAKYDTIIFFAYSILAIISGTYHGKSIYEIKKRITEQEDQLNTKIMTIQSVSFGIYMLSTIFSVVVFGLFAVKAVSIDVYYISDILNTICATINQAMICYICWNIDNIPARVVRGDSEHDEVQVEETDQYFDLQLRLWL